LAALVEEARLDPKNVKVVNNPDLTPDEITKKLTMILANAASKIRRERGKKATPI